MPRFPGGSESKEEENFKGDMLLPYFKKTQQKKLKIMIHI